MKMRLLLPTLSALLAACNQPAAETSTQPVESESRVQIFAEAAPALPASTPPPPEPAPPPAAEPAPVVVADAPAPDPIAPEGTYFPLVALSITTREGIVGLKPGTRLRKFGPGQYRDGTGGEWMLGQDQVTNNLRIAGLAARADANAQAAMRQAVAQSRMPTPAPAPVDATADVPANPAPSPFMPRRSSSVVQVRPAASPTDAAGRPIFSSGALGAVHSRQQDNGYIDVNGLKHWKDIRGNWHISPP